jgi:hypothetical protein
MLLVVKRRMLACIKDFKAYRVWLHDGGQTCLQGNDLCLLKINFLAKFYF